MPFNNLIKNISITMLHRRHLRIPIRSILNLQHASLSTEAQSSATSKLDPCEIPKRESNQNLDNFSEEFAKSRIEATPFQKLILTVGSSIVALVDPHRHDMIACLGETTGTSALDTILKQMKGTEEGQRILTQKPRINTKTIDIDSLRNLPEDTFGRAYAKFLDDNAVTPDSRMEVRFVESAQLAYVMTRYRECHDLIHTILGMPTNMLGEVAVKWVEALNTGLPMCYGGAVFGAARLRPKQRKEYVSRYLPWAIQHGLSVKPLMSVYWEERWQQPIASLRKELGIRLLE